MTVIDLCLGSLGNDVVRQILYSNTIMFVMHNIKNIDKY